jgi:PncC family amidohydrolase
MARIERRLVDSLLRQRAVLVTVESCTGGGIANRITQVAGSSDVFWGAIVSYQLRAKTRLLGISARDLEKHGAVSRRIAAAMAEAGYRLSKGAGRKVVVVSTTGVAGPGGGSRRTPVGLCLIGVASSRSRGRARVVAVRPARRTLSRSAQKARFAARALAEALREVTTV